MLRRAGGCLFGLLALAPGCIPGQDAPAPAPEHELGRAADGLDHAVVYEPLGRVALFAGEDIADKIARGQPVLDPAFEGAFLRVRIPAPLAAAVQAAPEQRVYLSLEKPAPGVDLLVHEPAPGPAAGTRRMRTIELVPGEPWLSGHLRIGLDAEGRLVAAARIRKASGTLPLTHDEVDTGGGCAAEAGCPPLRYADADPCRWPEVPAGWPLVDEAGRPAALPCAVAAAPNKP
jgi:hypothetical protein